jgi:histidyl-tRNA synthetase
MLFERPRGVRDFGPDVMPLRLHIKDELGECMRSYGYHPILTPAFEFADLFLAKSGQDIADHLYVFDDKAGRKLCLRPEATAQVARIYASTLRTRPKPLRLSYEGPMYRYEEPQRGRYREFWQLGAELIGAGGPAADAEIISLASQGLRRLGLAHTLRIGHIGLFRQLLSLEGLNNAGQDEIIRLLDRGEFEKVREKIPSSGINQLIKIKGKREAIHEAKENVKDEKGQMILGDIEKTVEYLDNAQTEYELDFSMSRGLDYYTGIVFDAKVEGLGAQNQVMGGGRYDRLIELFGGPPTPAIGFAYGLDRLVEAFNAQKKPYQEKKTDVLVIPVDEETMAASFRIASEIRAKLPDKAVEIDLSGRRLNKALQYASNKGVGYAIIVGSRELADDCVTVKNLALGVQEKTRLDKIQECL